MDWWVVALRFTGLGWYIAFCIVTGILGGLWLDRVVGTRPLFTLLGLFVGLSASGYGVYKMVEPLLKEGDNQGVRKNGG